MYSESHGTESVLQSVVLPDGNYWGFIYDAADPSAPLQNYYNSPPVSKTPSIGYGTLTKILTPEGCSISYQYNGTIDCGVYSEGPITDPKDLAAAIKRGLAVVKRGEPYLIDVVTQPR